MKHWKDVFLHTPDFEDVPAFAELTRLAKTPLDLTQEGVLSTSRIEKYCAAGASLQLLYGFQRVNDQVLDALRDLAAKRCAVEQMMAMQEGYPINWIENYASEQRACLHTAQRNLFSEVTSLNDAAHATAAAKKEHVKLQAFMKECDEGKRFTEMIFVGIGGSELGPKALYQALRFYWRKDRTVHFVTNVDPDDVAITLGSANLEKSLVVVISKSGTTLETATNEEFLRAEFLRRGLDPKDHFVAVTMPKTPMDDMKRYREVFYVGDYVGGRYSSTSMVGGVMLAFGVGYEPFVELLRGAADMDAIALQPDVLENLPLLFALLSIWNRNFLQLPTVACIPYSQLLGRFPAHLQQCDMESNGKHITRKGEECVWKTGPVVWGEVGTNAQHSFFQLLHQGTDIIPVEFIGFANPQGNLDFEFSRTTSHEKLVANMFAQAISLATGKHSENPNKRFYGNRPSTIILAKKLTPYVLGALLALYEHKVAFEGFIWGINSFDQEGVQLGKHVADQILAVTAARRAKQAIPEGAGVGVGGKLLEMMQGEGASDKRKGG